MRILFDALAATKRSGGMELHAREMIRAWVESFPEDDISVVGGSSFNSSLEAIDGLTRYTWPNESILLRAPGQVLVEPIIGKVAGADAVVSLSPIVSPLARRGRSACFQHDWRHLVNPSEFSSLQKAYRRLWAYSAARAGVNVCISEKAERETLQVAPLARTVVVENGRDHARRWVTSGSGSLDGKYVLTFGHHNNKRPDLVLDAFSLLDSRDFEEARLVILGARGALAQSLRDQAGRLGVADRVDLPGFVSDSSYQKYVSHASAIVLASTDEGFGLPLAEAEYFSIPAVVASDSGVSSLFPAAHVAEPTAAEFARMIEIAVANVKSDAPPIAWGWADAASATRAALISHLF